MYPQHGREGEPQDEPACLFSAFDLAGFACRLDLHLQRAQPSPAAPSRRKDHLPIPDTYDHTNIYPFTDPDRDPAGDRYQHQGPHSRIIGHRLCNPQPNGDPGTNAHADQYTCADSRINDSYTTRNPCPTALTLDQ